MARPLSPLLSLASFAQAFYQDDQGSVGAELRIFTVEELIELNKKVLIEVRAKKADRHQVLSRVSLQKALENGEVT